LLPCHKFKGEEEDGKKIIIIIMLRLMCVCVWFSKSTYSFLWPFYLVYKASVLP
jgi:hypothetical protein